MDLQNKLFLNLKREEALEISKLSFDKFCDKQKMDYDFNYDKANSMKKIYLNE